MMVDGSLPSHFALHCAYCDAFLSRRLSLLHALCLQVVPPTRSTRVLHRHSPFSRTAPSNNKSLNFKCFVLNSHSWEYSMNPNDSFSP